MPFGAGELRLAARTPHGGAPNARENARENAASEP